MIQSRTFCVLQVLLGTNAMCGENLTQKKTSKQQQDKQTNYMQKHLLFCIYFQRYFAFGTWIAQ